MKIHPQIREALESTGLLWSIERGGKHFKIRVGGRLVGILPSNMRKEAHSKAILSTVTQIRRAASRGN